jgi:hypothetical protein
MQRWEIETAAEQDTLLNQEMHQRNNVHIPGFCVLIVFF